MPLYYLHPPKVVVSLINYILSIKLNYFYQQMNQTEIDIQYQNRMEQSIVEKKLKSINKRMIIASILIIFIFGLTLRKYLAFGDMRYEYSKRRDTLHREISIKRQNENMLKKLINITYNEYPQEGHFFSPVLNDRLIKYYNKHNIKSVADFGCGKCEYILNLNTAGFIAQGFDGHPWNDDNSSQVVKKMDLSQNVSLGEMFDYVQSFEVGEHIYSDFEQNFIHNIVNHASKGIILSWEILGQTGYLHVNNRDNDYIIPKIEAHGFTFDLDNSLKLRQGFSNHFANTIMVFHKN